MIVRRAFTALFLMASPLAAQEAPPPDAQNQASAAPLPPPEPSAAERRAPSGASEPRAFKVAAPWAGAKIHRAEDILLHSFDPGCVDAAVEALERRNTVTLTVTESQLYLELNGIHLSSAVHTQPVATG